MFILVQSVMLVTVLWSTKHAIDSVVECEVQSMLVIAL